MLTYTRPHGRATTPSPSRTSAGNETATFTTGVNSVPDVVNNSAVRAAGGDTTAPTLSSAAVNQGGLFVQLQFSENVDQSNLPPVTAVTVTADGSDLTTTGVVVATGQLHRYWVLVAPAIRQGQAVVVTYTDPSGGNDANAFQDTSGNDAASFRTGSRTPSPPRPTARPSPTTPQPLPTAR